MVQLSDKEALPHASSNATPSKPVTVVYRITWPDGALAIVAVRTRPQGAVLNVNAAGATIRLGPALHLHQQSENITTELGSVCRRDGATLAIERPTP